MYQKIDHVLGEANCISRMGDIHFRESRNPEARTAFEKALSLYKKIAYVNGEANCIMSSGQILIREGKIKDGLANLDQALRLYGTVNDRYHTANAYYDYALLLLLKDIDEYRQQAGDMFAKAAEIFTAINLPLDAEKCKKLLRYIDKPEE